MSTRRGFLGATGLLGTGLLAGCLAGGGRPGGGDDTASPSPTPSPSDIPSPPGTTGNGSDGDGGAGGTRPTGTGGPAATLASVDRRPDLPIRPTVELLDPVATEDHPPRLRVRVENGADRTITVGEARAVVFEYVTADSGELVLLPAGGDYPVDAGCWRLTDAIAVTTEYRTAALAPGESLSADLELYGTPTDEDACLPVGEHRFASTYSVSEDDGTVVAEGTADGNGTADGDGSAGRSDGEGLPAEGTWGFSLLLE